MTATAILLVILLALTAYLVLGGADFGGGIWDLLAHGDTAHEQRSLISRSIGPVWEANHVWLVLALTATFSAFPPLYEQIGQGLAVPVACALLGIVLRGAAYVYKSYGDGAAGPDHLWGRVFAIASAVTPYMLGVTAAGLATGRLNSGAGLLSDPFAALTGGLAVVSTAFLAAVYLCHDAAGTALVKVFRRRALAGAVLAGALALALIPLLPSTLDDRLARAVPLIALSATAGVTTLILLWRNAFRAARISAAVAVAAILWGWAAAQYPALIIGRLTVSSAAATGPALQVVLGVLIAGLLLMAPAVAVLFRVFSR